MTDISVTASSVVPSTSLSDLQTVKAGAAITAGQPIYLDSSNEAQLADCDASAAAAAAVGIAVNNAAAGQRVSYQKSGTLTLNAVLTPGVIYVASATAGGIAPSADLGSGDYVTILGVAATSTTLSVHIHASGNQV